MSGIPFNRPYVTGAETGLMIDAMRRGHISGDGYYTARASQLLADILNVPDVLLTTSCTHALEMAAMLLGIEPGDEVIMPSFTFVSTANAFVLRGAQPIFVDIRLDTHNINEKLIEQSITPRTRAIVVVHYAGIACEMDQILVIARRHGLAVVEDNAHGLGARYHGRPLGSFGSLATLSFHETKNIQCGEGGALIMNDRTFVEQAEVIREKGTNRSRFFRGQVDRYTWVGMGSSYLPSDLLAAFLTAQLEQFDDIQRQRMSVWNAYASRLSDWATHAGFALPDPPAYVEHPAHLFWMIAPDLDVRERFIAHMRDRGVNTPFHYVPLHSSPMGLPSHSDDLPVTDYVSTRLVRLPLFAGLRPGEVDRVVEATVQFTP
jgi:dTDP-4-amino-4,6-dideoxygalactose transaminase